MRLFFSKITAFYKLHPHLGYVFVGLFGVLFFGLMQVGQTFADPDSFYHAKISALMLERGIIREFPWLTYVFLPENYTDHHFLYHALLIPFVKFFSPLIGIKIATTCINTVFVLLFYGFLRKNNIARPFFFVALLLLAAPFIFRINLDKANGLSLIFIMLILFFIFNKKHWALALLSFFYVWSYGGWPIGIFLVVIYFIASFMARYIYEGKFWPIFRIFSVEWKLLIAVIGGSLSGLIINPYFPQNLKFYWTQVVQIALINYQDKIGVGGEWYKFDLAELISYSGPVMLIIIFSMMFFFGKIFLSQNKNISREAIKNIFFFVFIAGLFFVLTLKSCRNTEYFFPFAVLSAAFILKYFWDEKLYLGFKKNIIAVFRKEFFYRVFIIYLVLAFILNFGLNFLKIKHELARGFSFDYYKEAMDIARENSQPGDIIFHSDWDDWPMLFYHNHNNNYIVGLDTTFMYKHNSELFKKWRDITWGNFLGDPHGIIKNEFHAVLIFIAENDINIMDKYFKNDVRYELLYDKEGRVYKIR